MGLSLADAVPWSVWKHLKTQSRYVVLGVATRSTNGDDYEGDFAVVYQSHATGRLHYRHWADFLDGRFVRES